MNKQIELSEEEINVTIQLIDVAIKAGGLQVSEAGSILAKKFGSYLQQQNAEPNSSEFASEPTDFEVVEEKD
tara:strand:- start:412 stop:627 length:216 start_codon:yes stop_codon:yes gene_type:complete